MLDMYQFLSIEVTYKFFECTHVDELLERHGLAPAVEPSEHGGELVPPRDVPVAPAVLLEVVRRHLDQDRQQLRIGLKKHDSLV